MFKYILIKAQYRIRQALQNDQYRRYKERYSILGRFNGENIKCYGEGDISIGINTYLGSNSRLQSKKGEYILIGNDCAISHNVAFYTSTYIWSAEVSKRSQKSGSIEIGNNVWIGINTVILPGVSIPSNTVIGANSVVTKSITVSGIYAGAPLRLIKKL